MQSEYEAQKNIFRWAEIMSSKWPELRMLNGSLNGVRLTIGQAVKAKNSGMKRGFPDLQLPVPKGDYFGLFIELKKEKGGVISPEQREWIKALSLNGYFACVCHGYDKAVEIIKRYLEGEVFE